MAFLGGARKYVGGAAVGLAAGFTLGCVGWGGAQIIKPSLTTFLGISQLAANGTSLTSLSAAATTGALRFGFSDSSDLATAACIAVPSVLGARVGVVLAQRMSSEVLGLIFNGISVVLIPTHFFVQRYREQHPHKDNGSSNSGLRWFLPPSAESSAVGESAGAAPVPAPAPVEEAGTNDASGASAAAAAAAGSAVPVAVDNVEDAGVPPGRFDAPTRVLREDQAASPSAEPPPTSAATASPDGGDDRRRGSHGPGVAASSGCCDNGGGGPGGDLADLPLSERLRHLNPLVLQHLAFGGAMGVVSALMGVGGAPLCMSYLTVGTDLPHHLVQGTMMVAVLPAVLTSAASLAFAGHTPLALAASVCCGSTVGAWAGAEFALHLSESQLRSLYMASLVILGGRSFVAAFGNVSRLSRTYFRKGGGGGGGVGGAA